MYTLRVLLLALIGVVLSGGTGATARAGREPRVLFPGGVRDPQGHSAYVSAEGGGLDALSLAGSPGGARRWTTKAASEPVLATRDWLVAADWASSGRAFHLVALDAARGTVRQRAETAVKLPEQKGSITAAWREGDSVIVSWESHNEYHGGPAPTEQMSARLGRTAAGAVAFDVKTGALTPRAAPTPTSTSVPSLPAAARELTLFPVQSGDSGLWHAGDRVAVVALDSAGDHRRLALHAFSQASGRADPPVTLIERPPADGYLILVPPLDPSTVQLIVINDQPVGGQPPGSITRYEFYDVPSGVRRGGVLQHPGMQPPLGSHDGRAYYLEDQPAPANSAAQVGWEIHIPRRLVAVDLASGRTLWMQPVAARAFPVPMP